MPTAHLSPGLGRLPFWAAIFITLICVSILGLSGWRESESRAVVLGNAETSMANMARSLAQHAEDSLEMLDASIVGAVSRLEIDGTSPPVISRLRTVLEARKATIGRIHGLAIYDANGRWPASVEDPNPSGPDVNDRTYFQHHKTSPSRDAFVGPPIKSRIGGTWTVTLSRRFNHRDGSFAGVVLASISVEYFSQFYQLFNVGSHGTISLLGQDGTMLARSRDPLTFVGTDLSKTRLFSELLPRANAGPYYFISPLDGLNRLGFYDVSHRFPLVVLATMDQEQVLAPWREAAITRSIFTVLLTSLIAAIGFVLVRELHLRQRLASAVMAKEADFRVLSEESSDMVTRIGCDERLQYVSPSSAAIVGWSRDQLIGTPALARHQCQGPPKGRGDDRGPEGGDHCRRKADLPDATPPDDRGVAGIHHASDPRSSNRRGRRRRGDFTRHHRPEGHTGRTRGSRHQR